MFSFAWSQEKWTRRRNIDQRRQWVICHSRIEKVYYWALAEKWVKELLCLTEWNCANDLSLDFFFSISNKLISLSPAILIKFFGQIKAKARTVIASTYSTSNNVQLHLIQMTHTVGSESENLRFGNDSGISVQFRNQSAKAVTVNELKLSSNSLSRLSPRPFAYTFALISHHDLYR